MSTEEVVLPDAPVVDAGADGQQQTAAPEAEAKPEGEAREGEQKPQKTPEEKEIARLRRRVDNLTRRLYEGKQATDGLHNRAETRDNTQQQADSDALSLTRAELQELIDKEARKRAPTIAKQEAEEATRRERAKGLFKELGEDQFKELTNDLAGVFRDTGKQLAVLESDNPRALLEYLTDPDNADEAERIADMPDIRAGRALAAIEAKLAKPAEKPQRSNAPAPIEPGRGSGKANTAPDPRDTKAWIAWANKQEHGR